MLTAPTIRTACGTPPGVQIARSGGATQAPCGVLTTTTPRGGIEQLAAAMLMPVQFERGRIFVADRDHRPRDVLVVVRVDPRQSLSHSQK